MQAGKAAQKVQQSAPPPAPSTGPLGIPWSTINYLLLIVLTAMGGGGGVYAGYRRYRSNNPLPTEEEDEENDGRD